MKAKEMINKLMTEGKIQPHELIALQLEIVLEKDEYSSLQIKEAIEDIEKSDDSVFTNGEPTHFGKGVKTGKQIAIEILKSKLK
jgi:hypothetical protein